MLVTASRAEGDGVVSVEARVAGPERCAAALVVGVSVCVRAVALCNGLVSIPSLVDSIENKYALECQFIPPEGNNTHYSELEGLPSRLYTGKEVIDFLQVYSNSDCAPDSLDLLSFLPSYECT